MNSVDHELLMNPYFYKVLEISKVVDGDTVDLVLDLGFRMTMEVRVRMEGYDAPEIWHPRCHLEYEAGIKVKKFLEEILSQYKSNLYIATHPLPGIYGRWSGTLYAVLDSGSTICINTLVIDYMKAHGFLKEVIWEECSDQD